MKNVLLSQISFVLIFLPCVVFSQTPSRIAIETQNQGMDFFIDNEIDFVHGFLNKDGRFIGDFDSENSEKISSLNVNYNVLIDDLKDYYQSAQNANIQTRLDIHPCFVKDLNYSTPVNFQLGSVGGYFTFEEYLAEIDNMISLYPNLISEKTIIGNSIEENPIHVMRISNNPNQDQQKPQVLYTSIHHSQEPASLSVVLFYMYYLLENYQTNPEVTYLIDNTELFFIPMINPDGYIHNLSDNETGGMHRKNRRTSTFSDGVDLNRNYDWYFGHDNVGSSGVGFHPWYRGDSAFSEPETQAVKSFLESKNILIDLNWHSYGNMIIYPWNYENHYTADSLMYVKMGETMTYYNNYRYGTVAETYGYQCNGDADDWGYGEQNTKNKIISLTGEVGNMDDGFWPDIDRIIPLCKDAIWTNLAIAHFAHAFPEYKDLSSKLIDNQNAYMKFEIKNVGLKENANFSISFTALSSNISFMQNSFDATNLSNMEAIIDSVEYQIHTDLPIDNIVFEIAISNDNYTFRDTIEKIFATKNILVNDDCESIDNWDGNWDITDEDAFSGNFSITDSPNSNYGIFNNKALEYIHDINLENSVYAFVNFMFKKNTEHNHDYVQIFASVDNGDSWTPLCGRYSKYGSDDEDEGQPVYHGNTPQWTFEEISLNDFVGNIIKLKFHFNSDQTTHKDGFYFDDFKVISVDQEMVDNKLENFSNINVYPNPVNEMLYIETLQHDNMYIYNILGELIHVENISNQKTKISVADWPNGLYFYLLPELNISGRFIKQ